MRQIYWVIYHFFSCVLILLKFGKFLSLSFFPWKFAAGSVNDVQAAIEHIFPLVYEFRKKRTVEAVIPAEVYDLENDEDLSKLNDKFGTNRQTNGEIKTDKKKAIKRKYPFGMSENDPINDNMIVSDQDDLDDDDMDDL